MFCPKCGKGDQEPEAYCRQCGGFLPDLSRRFKPEISPEEHLKANLTLSAMTVVASFTLAILIYTVLGFHTGTHPLIYVVGGFLVAIGAWQVQTVIRTWKLRQQWKRRVKPVEDASSGQPSTPTFAPRETARQLGEADFSKMTPASVTEATTKTLVERTPAAE